ncbi:MAG: YcdB/YcdC domain-containing protein, partial [Oscillospiraceae bacterium]
MKKQLIMKIASMAMALSLVASSGAAAVSAATKTTGTSSGSSAEEKEQRAMKEALTVVKKRVKIPDSISKFNYSVTQSYGEECFNFSWETPEDSKSNIRECINISVVQNIIVSYNYSKYYTDGSDKNDWAPAFAKLSDKQLIEKAKGYCKQLNPDLTSISDIEISSVSLFEDYAYVTFGRKENGIDIPDNGGSVAMNKDTGELISYGISGWYYDGTQFASPKSKLTAAEAQAKYKEYCTLTPSYRIISTWNEETKEYDRKPVLIYSPDFTDEIDALTGEKSTIWNDMSKDKGTNWFPFANHANPSFWSTEAEEDCCDEEVAAGAADNGVVFTKEELKEIEADETMLKKEEITALLQKDKYIQLPDYVPIKRAELVKDEKKDLYKYSMYYYYNDGEEEPIDYADGEEVSAESKPYFSLSVTLNAKTGKVDYFSKNYDAKLDNSKAYPVKSCSAIADKVIKYYYPDICGEYKADESNLAASDSWTNSTGKTYYETSRRFVYHRYVNGVIVEGDNIYVTVD